jgi:LPS export ABC transporter protein LptC
MKKPFKKGFRYFFFRLFFTGIVGMMIIISCRNDIETIQALETKSDLPAITLFDMEMEYTDSGLLKGKIIAPEAFQYSHPDEPYYEFPSGMTAVIYAQAGDYTIKANYGIYFYEKQLWEGRNQVRINNFSTGERIETEQIFWDQKEKRIYSDKYTKVTNKDGIFIGEKGIEADDEFNKFRMIGYSGTVTVKDNPQTGETTVQE